MLYTAKTASADKHNAESRYVRIYRLIHDDEGTEVTVREIKDAKGNVSYKRADGTPLFTQDQVNHEIALQKKKLAEGRDAAIQELETLKEAAGASEALKAELEKRIKDLKDQTTAELEDWKGKHKALEDKYQKDLKKVSEERDAIQSAFHQKLISTDILSACGEHKALNAEIMEPLIAPRASIVDELDAESKPTGRKVVRVSYEDLDSEGKNKITKSVPVNEYVKWMKGQDDRFGNLFASDEASGQGRRQMSNKPGASDITKENIKDMDLATYKARQAAGAGAK